MSSTPIFLTGAFSTAQAAQALATAMPSVPLWAELCVLEKACQEIDPKEAKELSILRNEYQRGLNQLAQIRYAERLWRWDKTKWTQILEKVHTRKTPLSRGAKLSLAKQTFNAMHKLCEENETKLRVLPENDEAGLRKLYESFKEEQRNLNRTLKTIFDPKEEEQMYQLAMALSSSINQWISAVQSEMEVSLEYLKANRGAKWERAIGTIPTFKEKRMIYLVGEKGYEIDHAKRELAEIPVRWLRAYRPNQEDLKENTWVLKFPDQLVETKEGGPLSNSFWPPDPKKDPVLKTILEILGWEMTVRGNVVRVRFTPSTPSEPLAQAKQLAEELYQLCKSAYDKILKVNPKKAAISLPQILREFEEEVLRLQDLFPKTGLKQLDKLIHYIKRSSAQLTAVMRLSMKLARDNFNEGTKWEHAIEMIVNPNKMKEIKLLEGKGYHIRYDKVELADLLVEWLLLHKPDESWEGQIWVLKFPKAHPRITFTKETPFEESPWPPSPQKDFVLKTGLEILGWQMTMEEKEDHLMVKISFGILYFKGAS